MILVHLYEPGKQIATPFPDVVACFPQNMDENGSPAKLIYCILYLLASALLTGFGFYLYFHHLLIQIRRQYRKSFYSVDDIELKSKGLIKDGDTTNKQNSVELC